MGTTSARTQNICVQFRTPLLPARIPDSPPAGELRRYDRYGHQPSIAERWRRWGHESRYGSIHEYLMAQHGTAHQPVLKLSDYLQKKKKPSVSDRYDGTLFAGLEAA